MFPLCFHKSLSGLASTSGRRGSFWDTNSKLFRPKFFLDLRQNNPHNPRNPQNPGIKTTNPQNPESGGAGAWSRERSGVSRGESRRWSPVLGSQGRGDRGRVAAAGGTAASGSVSPGLRRGKGRGSCSAGYHGVRGRGGGFAGLTGLRDRCSPWRRRRKGTGSCG